MTTKDWELRFFSFIRLQQNCVILLTKIPSLLEQCPHMPCELCKPFCSSAVSNHLSVLCPGSLIFLHKIQFPKTPLFFIIKYSPS